MRSTIRPLCLPLLLLCAGLLQAPPAHAEEAAGKQPLDLLHAGQYATLDAHYDTLQRDYQNGRIGEQQLYDGFRALYQDDPANAQLFDQWVAAFPRSYAARTARGAYWYRMSLAVLNGRIAADKMQWRRDLERAQPDLEASLPMTRKPYISALYLLNVAMQGAPQEQWRKWLELGDSIDPNNLILRRRYMMGLGPDYGGSYQKMRGFLEHCRSEHLPQALIAQLDMEIQTEQGEADARAGNYVAGFDHWDSVLQQAEAAGVEAPAEAWVEYATGAWQLHRAADADRALRHLEQMQPDQGWILTRMGWIYVQEKRMTEAWTVLRKSAGLQDPEAEYSVGKTIFLGCVDIQQPPDHDAGVVWLRRAAEHGNSEARTALRYDAYGHFFTLLYFRFH